METCEQLKIISELIFWLGIMGLIALYLFLNYRYKMSQLDKPIDHITEELE